MMSVAERIGYALGMSAFAGRERRDVQIESVRASGEGYSLIAPQWQYDKPIWGQSRIGDYRKAYASTVAVYACVIARAGGVASAPLKVYQEADGDSTEVPDHPLRRLMTRPNPELSEAEWIALTQVLMDATGFAAIQKVRNAFGQVVELWHLRSDWLKEIKRANRASDWEYRIPDGRKFLIDAADVVIIAGGPSTDLGPTGLSPIAVAMREAQVESSLTDFLKMFIDNGAVPRHALVIEDTIDDPAYAEELKAAFTTAYGGVRNWSKVALLTGGTKLEKVGVDLDEMAYPELRYLTEAHICSAFGVPPIVANMTVGLEAATYSNYEQARRAFYESTIRSLWDRMEGALTRGLLDEFEDRDSAFSLEFDTSAVPALQDNAQDVWERSRAAALGGLITVNQFQASVGLPGFGEAGDVLYLPLGVEPIRPDDLLGLADMTIEPPQPIPAALGAGTGEGEDAADTGDGDDSDSAGRALDRPRVVAGDGARGNGKVHVRTVPLETRSRIGRNNRRQITRLASRFRGKLIALFKKHGAKVRDAFKDNPDVDALPWDDMDLDMQRELGALHQTAGKTAFGQVEAAIGVETVWDLGNPHVRDVLGRLATRIVGVNETTRDDVRRVVNAGLEAGKTVNAIADDLYGLYAESYRNRSLAIARTESQVAYNLATQLGYKETGVVLSVECLDNPNHTEGYGASDGLSCAERNGTITELDAADIHIFAEHPNGTLAISPVLVTPLGE
jgi:HK97 family phage portal protein